MKRPGRLEITTKIGCSCNCVYCPQEKLIKRYFGRPDSPNPDKMLSLDNFKICIDKLPKGTRIDFSGMAEPWLNLQCTDMVLYAHEKGFPIAIYTTLVGMKREDFDKIRQIPVEEFVLHIPDDKSNAHIGVSSEYIALLETVVSEKRDDGSPYVTGFSCHAGIHPDIVSKIPEDSKLITELHDRAGNVESEYVESKCNKGTIVCINCDNSIHHNVLLPDGTVLLCCMDYGMKHILGNLLTQSYEEIHESEEAKRIIRGMADDREQILCRTCVNARNIDEVYDEYYLHREWVSDLQRQNNQCIKENQDYKIWVENLQNQQGELKLLYDGLQNQNQQFLDDNKKYKEWVENLEKQKNELFSQYKDALGRIETIDALYKDQSINLDDRLRELNEYKIWVSNLQTQNDEVKKQICCLQKDYENEKIERTHAQKNYSETLEQLKDMENEESSRQRQVNIQLRELYNNVKNEREDKLKIIVDLEQKIKELENSKTDLEFMISQLENEKKSQRSILSKTFRCLKLYGIRHTIKSCISELRKINEESNSL